MSRSTGSRAPGRYSPIAIAVISRSVISSTRDGVSELPWQQPRQGRMRRVGLRRVRHVRMLNPDQWSCTRPLRVHADRHDTYNPAGAVPRPRNLGADHRARRRREGALPLFVLHGGPGMAHNYVRNIAELADETGRTVIHYDQIGCGNSTHLPDAPADFWTPELFVDEFHTVREALASTSITCLASPGAACSARRSRSGNRPGSRHWRSATPPPRWSCGWRAAPSCAHSCQRRLRPR